MVTGTDVVQAARGWLGTKWQHGTCLKGVACDCIGLIGGVAAELGLSDVWVTDASFQFKGYGPQPDPKRLLEACDHFLKRVQERQPGDVLVMKYERAPMHFAILAQAVPPYIIHSHARVRKVVEHGMDAVWAARVVRVYRLPGVA